MHKIRALCPLIRTETLKKATAGRGKYEQLQMDSYCLLYTEITFSESVRIAREI